MIFNFILNGLGDIFGYSILVILLLMLSFLLLMVSRGAGITSLIGTFILGVYLFSTTDLDYIFITNEYFIIITILFGLLIGFLFYVVFLRD